MVGTFAAVFRRITRKRPLKIETSDKEGKEDESGLKECLTPVDLVSLGVGSCCGAGMYLTCGIVTGVAGGPGAIIAFIVSGIASLLSGMCYSELASVCPKTSGSAYIYSYTAVGELIAYIIAWGLIAEYVIGTALASVALSVTIDSMSNFAIKDFFTTWGAVGGREYFDILAVIICFVLTIILISGVKISALINNILNLINLAVLVFFIGISIFYSNVTDWATGVYSEDWGVKLLSQIPTAYFAFIGFDGIAATGGEAKNPSKNIPLCVILSIIICTIIYVAVSVCLSVIVPFSQLPQQTAMLDVFVMKNNLYAKYIVSVGAVCGLFAAAFGSMFPLPRILCAMAQDGLIHKYFQEISPRSKTPRFATLVTGIFATILAISIDLTYLLELVLMGTLLSYILVAVSVLVLRYSLQERQNGYERLEPELEEEIELFSQDTNADKGRQRTNTNSTETNEEKQHIYPKYKAFGPLVTLFQSWSALIVEKTGVVSSLLCIILTMQLSICVAISLIVRNMLKFNTVMIVVLAISVVILFILTALLATVSQNQMNHQSFRVPMVPFLPLLVTMINIYFIVSLSTFSWILFSIWMAVGFLVYFTFSIRSDVFKSVE